MLNATYDDDANVITRHGALHMGMATQTPNGLMVAVIRDAQALERLATRVRDPAPVRRRPLRQGGREELIGSTITLSSLGPMGGITSTPVINRPEVAIIAVNKVEEKLVPVDGEIEVRKRMNLSLSCDHRVVDGWDAASFMQTLKGYIENPMRCCPPVRASRDGRAQARRFGQPISSRARASSSRRPRRHASSPPS